jgi:hypothetical protein
MVEYAYIVDFASESSVICLFVYASTVCHHCTDKLLTGSIVAARHVLHCVPALGADHSDLAMEEAVW